MTSFGYAWCAQCGQPIEWVDHTDSERRKWGPGWLHGWTNSPRPRKLADPTVAHDIEPVQEKVDA